MVRPLQPGDLRQLPSLWTASHSASRASDLQRIAEDAVHGSGNEHKGLVSPDRNGTVRAAVLFRFVAGAVGTGEIEAVAATDPVLARELLAAAVEQLRLHGARLVVAEYPGTPATAWYTELLGDAGFTVRAVIGDYFGEAEPLIISVLGE